MTGLLSYPFSRAHRVDFSGGARQIGVQAGRHHAAYDYYIGPAALRRRENARRRADSLNLGEASAALVFDTSISGVTSPIRGSRYRLEVAQTAGTITLHRPDGRRPHLPDAVHVPFTFAFRGLFYGRYGSDAEDFRLPTLYLGYPGLVRGYDSERRSNRASAAWRPDGSCPVFDRLLGSRVAIVNAEMRFPLWALFGGSNFYGPLPVEMALFADSGVAWGQSNSQQFAHGSNKEPVSSVGVAMRANLFGFAVARARLRPAARSPGPRLALAVQSDAGILNTCYVLRVLRCNVLRTCDVLRASVPRATCARRRARARATCLRPSTLHV